MKYRKKPVEIETFQFKGSLCYSDIGEWCVPQWAIDAYHEGVIFEERGEFYIRTLEGVHHISNGDYVIKGIQGELYSCKPNIFEQTYEKVTSNEEFINPSQPKNKYIYTIDRDWKNSEIIHIHKYPVIYSNKTMTYYKIPGSAPLGSVYNINIVSTLEEASNILARDRKFCSIVCLENPGHTFEDKENLLGRAKRKEDLVQKLDILNKEKNNIENQIRGLIAKKEFNAFDISKIEKEIKRIDKED